MSETSGQQTAAAEQPSKDEMEKYVKALDKVMANESTRVAWLMGFLTGSALVGDPEEEAQLSAEPPPAARRDLGKSRRRPGRRQSLPGPA
jgi:hypothetical protein